MMAGYDMDFAAIVQCEIHERSFGRSTALLFPCLIQWLGDAADVTEILGFNEIVSAMATAQSRMKDSACRKLSMRPHVLIIMALAPSEGPSSPIESIDTQGCDVGVSMNFNIGEKREIP